MTDLRQIADAATREAVGIQMDADEVLVALDVIEAAQGFLDLISPETSDDDFELFFDDSVRELEYAVARWEALP